MVTQVGILRIFETNFMAGLGCSLSADPNITDLFQGEHPEILAGIEGGIDNTRHRVYSLFIVSYRHLLLRSECM